MRTQGLLLGAGLLLVELLVGLGQHQYASHCGTIIATTLPVCHRLLWFTAVDAISTAEGSYRLWNAKAALDSALEHAPSLVPVLIYGGKADDPIARHFSDRGAFVILHDVNFLPNKPESLRKRRAQYYRLDAAHLAAEFLKNQSIANVSSTAFLYTDTDVLIERDISSCSFANPSVLALSPESQKSFAFNSGVMAINIEGFLGIYDQLLEYARSVNWTFYQGTLQDQGLINEFMDRSNLPIELLRNEFNWKGYWGSNPARSILHYHGMKADLCLRTYVKSRHCHNGLWKRVCGRLRYVSTHFKFIEQSPDPDMWTYMYRDYLHHVNQTDDLSPSCKLQLPLPPAIRPHNLTGLLTEESPST